MSTNKFHKSVGVPKSWRVFDDPSAGLVGGFGKKDSDKTPPTVAGFGPAKSPNKLNPSMDVEPPNGFNREPFNDAMEDVAGGPGGMGNGYELPGHETVGTKPSDARWN